MQLKKVLRGIYTIFERAILQGTGLGGWKRWMVYVVSIVSALTVIWVPLIAFIKLSPLTYTTKWTLTLPGSGVGSSINLESIGQAASAVNSPYTSPSLDPKVSYQHIVKSDAVLTAAAEAVGMTLEAFGKPRVKLVDQTTLMYFKISAIQPEQAYAKAMAIMQAFHAQLDSLRRNETERRTEAAQRYVQHFQDKLDRIQKQILTFQKDSALISKAPFEELALTVEKMRQEKAMYLAQYKKAEGQASQLAGMLSVTPEMAADLLTLQSNPVFDEYVQAYTEAQRQWTAYMGRWGANHPEVVKARQNAMQMRTAMLAKGESLIGYPLHRKSGLMEMLLSDSQTQRHELFQELIAADVNRYGVAAQIKSLEASIAQFQNRLTDTIDVAATLANLELQHRVAAAVLTTTLAQLDIGKSDPFSSYPLVQILEAPQVPQQPDTAKRTFALLGGGVASVFIVIGLTLSWKRQSLFQRILKSGSSGTPSP